MWPEFSFTDKIKFLIVLVSAFGGGALFMVGPGGMAEEIKWHREIGAGFMGFGVLILIALISVRAKALLIAMITGVISGAAAWGAIDGGFGSVYSVLIGVFGAFGLLFAGYSLLCVLTGEDPAE